MGLTEVVSLAPLVSAAAPTLVAIAFILAVTVWVRTEVMRLRDRMGDMADRLIELETASKPEFGSRRGAGGT